VKKNVDATARPSFRGLFTTSAGLLAVALLIVEFVGGIQTYVTSTVTPLAASDLQGQAFYGVAQGASQVGLFATLPLGIYLAARFDRSRLLLIFTMVAIVGAGVGAVAPTMSWYVAGRGITGLAAGALATIAMNVVATSLPKEWRRLVLAGYAGMWVITSLLGPLYASWISTLVGWRWTMILYLPLLVGARILVARHIPRSTSNDSTSREPLNVGASLALAIGIALVATAGSGWRVSVVLVPLGVIAVLIAAVSLLPTGTFRLRRGRPSAIAILGILTSVYFGASAVITITGHDFYRLSPAGIGVLLTLGGLGWAVVGFICGRRPSPDDRGFVIRVAVGGGLLTFALALIAVSPLLDARAISIAALFVGWAAAGAGMGLCYLELLSRIFDQPPASDGISAPQAASAAVMVEIITTALAATATAAAFSYASTESTVIIVFAALTIAAALIVVLLRRALPGPLRPEGSL
jgi:MFS family permease